MLQRTGAGPVILKTVTHLLLAPNALHIPKLEVPARNSSPMGACFIGQLEPFAGSFVSPEWCKGDGSVYRFQPSIHKQWLNTTVTLYSKMYFWEGGYLSPVNAYYICPSKVAILL